MIQKHILSRYLNSMIHKTWFSQDSATFPLWNLSGQLTGYQRYSPFLEKKRNNTPLGRYYTYRSKSKISVWGLESYRFSDTLFITEGIFDACRITWFEHSAIALLSNDPCQNTKKWLNIISKSRKLVSICDPDKAGKKLIKLSHDYHIMPDNIDLGDSSLEYVYHIIEKYR